MKYLSISLFALSLFVSNNPVCNAEPNKKEAGWTPLFNGKNLEGFDTFLGRHKELGLNKDPNNVFTIHDGMVHIYQDTKQGSKVPFGYFVTKKEYSNYHLRFEYKWGTKKFAPRTNVIRDAGVIYHMVGPQRVWPRGVECQVQEGDTGDIYTVYGARVTTTIDPNSKTKSPKFLEKEKGGIPLTQGSKGVTRIIKSETVEKEDWNKVECIINGSNSFVHIVNGVINNKGTDIQQLDKDEKNWVPLKKGKILFQAEGAEVFYRNIEIKELPKSE
jgi:3-keto-disaccharide hydrolase